MSLRTCNLPTKKAPDNTGVVVIRCRHEGWGWWVTAADYIHKEMPWLNLLPSHGWISVTEIWNKGVWDDMGRVEPHKVTLLVCGPAGDMTTLQNRRPDVTIDERNWHAERQSPLKAIWNLEAKSSSVFTYNTAFHLDGCGYNFSSRVVWLHSQYYY